MGLVSALTERERELVKQCLHATWRMSSRSGESHVDAARPVPADLLRELRQAAVTLPLSLLERAVVELVAEVNWPNFLVDLLTVSRRESTGVGRYTHFVDHGDQPLVDGCYAAGTRLIKMEGIHDVLFFEVVVSRSRIDFLELVTCGGEPWDGVERPWNIA